MPAVVAAGLQITNGWRLRSLRELRRTRRDRVEAWGSGGFDGGRALEVAARRVAKLETLCEMVLQVKKERIMFRDLPSMLSQAQRVRHIWALVRIFDRPDYRDAFLAGQIRFNTLGEYRRIEGEGDDFRGDAWEGVAACIQSEGVKLSFADHEVGGLAGPLVHHSGGIDGWNVCSFVALQWPADEPFDALDAPEVLEQIRIGPELRKFGEYVALIADGDAFLAAARKVGKEQDLRVRAGPVQYFDEGEFSGSVPQNLLGFVKRAVPYGAQREFRIVIPRENPEEEVLWLDLSQGAPWGYATTVDEFDAKVRLRER